MTSADDTRDRIRAESAGGTTWSCGLRISSSGCVTCGSSRSTSRKKFRRECAACSGTRSYPSSRTTGLAMSLAMPFVAGTR